MKLEVGKYYKTRDGRKVGPMVIKWLNDKFDHWGHNGSTACYNEIGIRWANAKEPESDLVEEWPSETTTAPTLSSETIDHIAIDSLKFHIADNDMEPLQKEAFRIVLRYYGVSV